LVSFCLFVFVRQRFFILMDCWVVCITYCRGWSFLFSYVGRGSHLVTLSSHFCSRLWMEWTRKRSHRSASWSLILIAFGGCNFVFGLIGTE
jgi:hypothetical protein